MIMIKLWTQKVNFLISHLLLAISQPLKLDIYKDDLFISSLLQSGSSHNPPHLSKQHPTFAQARNLVSHT